MRLSYLFFFILTVQFIQAQEFSKTITDAIENRQYEGAWKLIEKEHADSTAENVIKKVQFCLTYFSHTLYHQKFSFNNLADHENLFDYRQMPPSTEDVFTAFNPEKALLAARLKEPENRKINLALGDYYYDVYSTYGSQWIKDKKEVMALFYYHYLEAYTGNFKTATSVYAISLFYQSRRTYSEANKFLSECLTIDPNYAPAHYNLAYSYSLADSIELAVFHAEKAYELYEKKELKADAASMCGLLLGDLKKHEDAVNWLLISDALAPGNFYVYEGLLKAYLHLNKTAEVGLITKNLYYYDWRSGKVYNAMLDAYLEVNKPNELKLFLENELTVEPFDEEYRGFVYIHLCQLALRIEDKVLAQRYVDKAQESLAVSYDKDHSVFRVLESLNYAIQND